MDQDSKEVLDRLLVLTEENNKILRKMRRSQRLGAFVSFLYWAFIIAVSTGVYYYFAPKVSQFLAAYQQILEKTQEVRGIDTTSINNLLEEVKTLLPKQ